MGGRVVEHGGHQVDGDGEHYRGVVLRCNAAQGLEVPQLMKTRVISQIFCSKAQILGTVNKSIKIKFIGYPVLYVEYTIYFFNPLPAELLGCQ